MENIGGQTRNVEIRQIFGNFIINFVLFLLFILLFKILKHPSRNISLHMGYKILFVDHGLCQIDHLGSGISQIAPPRPCGTRWCYL